MEGIAEKRILSKPVRAEMPWGDYEDDGGYDDDASLMGKPATFADRISEAGFRELLGFLDSSMEQAKRREA